MATAQDRKDFDINGWFEVKNNPLSKEGVFFYRGAQIRLPDGTQPPDKDKLYGVYRPASELSNEEAINSFKLVPWVDEHAMLGSEDLGMTPAERKGVSGVVGEDVFFKDGVLYGNIKAFSETLAKKIDDGKEELSLGYRCRYEYKPGTWNGQEYDYVQRDLRGNHLALVNEGRMGSSVRVLDHDDTNLGQFIFTCDSLMEKKQMDINELIEQAAQNMGEVAKLLAEIKKAQGSEEQAEAPAAEAPEQEAPELPTKDEDVKEDFDVEQDEDEPEDSGDDDLTEKLISIVERLASRVEALEKGSAKDEDEQDKPEDEQVQTLDASDIANSTMAKIAARDKLHKRVSAFTGSFDASAMDAQDVAAYACRKLKLDAPKGQELAAINGYMAHRTPANQQKTVTAQDSASNRASFLDGQLN